MSKAKINEPETLTAGARWLFFSPQQFLVFAMWPNPKPDRRVTIHNGECPVVVRDPCRPVILNLLELNRCVPWIFQPQAILFDGRLLDIARKEIVTFPKGTRGATLHAEGMGKSGPRGTLQSPDERGDPGAPP